MYDPSQYLGEFTYLVSTLNISTGPATQIAQPNVNRVGLVLINDTGNGIGIATYPGFSLGQSQYLWPTGTTLQVLWKDVGALVTFGWWALSVAPSVTVTVTEVIYRPLGD